MADPELAALRAARLTQLQQSNTDENGQSAARSEDAEKRRAEEQMRRDLLATALEPAARERLSRIALVSPTRSNQIESILLRMLQAGQLRGRVSEQQLIDLLEQADEAQKKASGQGTIVFQRRVDLDDDDFDI
ncbi:DNA-binding TFAR19-related protein [Russula ochroleuca]|jgi:programmed cell death protein 5|uniref:DNA-binding TFAR19-related protein n=1 Tax=Russula ochroleuca TaxID=152965 RepID=A0A9P5MUS1_9AGAM|nr:DNA-binding TFAR19-related protein [Russula ochroleuca]KAF8479129.1 DNA-binding TFAR19-related protein [Russula ochroleuca]